MVVIDATTLLLMLRPGTPVPNGSDGNFGIALNCPQGRLSRHSVIVHAYDAAGESGRRLSPTFRF